MLRTHIVVVLQVTRQGSVPGNGSKAPWIKWLWGKEDLREGHSERAGFGTGGAPQSLASRTQFWDFRSIAKPRSMTGEGLRPEASLVKSGVEIPTPRTWSVQEQQSGHIHHTGAGHVQQPHLTAQRSRTVPVPLWVTSVQRSAVPKTCVCKSETQASRSMSGSLGCHGRALPSSLILRLWGHRGCSCLTAWLSSESLRPSRRRGQRIS